MSQNTSLAGRHIHFMGIGGIGMSALAEMAAARGAVVSGCDREDNENTRRLNGYGLRIDQGHDAAHVERADRVVYTSAIPADHPERIAAGDRAVKRGEFLAEIIRGTNTIGICGTHGKTTTTWLTAHLLIECGADPTVFLGGIAPALEGNLRIGASDWVVTEMDESDGSFLLPDLQIAAVTNIESDHLHHYGSFDNVRSAFRTFASGVEKDGVLVACCDDDESMALLAEHKGRRIGVGQDSRADLRCLGVAHRAGGQEFLVVREGMNLGRFRLPLPGEHNVMNALIAIAIALECHIHVDDIRGALEVVVGVERRMQKLGTIGSAALYSDYAHHPTEVRAAIQGARTLFRGGLLVVFQPHLYSRTRDYKTAFGEALSEADSVVLAPIYPAREEPLPGITSQVVADAVRSAGGACDGVVSMNELGAWIAERADQYEAVILMGAGDIDKVADDAMGRVSCQS